MIATSQSAYIRPHVLIITDDRDLATFLAEGLTIAGFWTSTVASGLQVLEVLRLRTFDLLIVDAALADFPAEELVQRLREPVSDSTTGRTDRPILVMASGVEEMSESTALHAGADFHLVAPVELESLAMTLFSMIAAWRDERPDVRWADEIATDAKVIQEDTA